MTRCSIAQGFFLAMKSETSYINTIRKSLVRKNIFQTEDSLIYKYREIIKRTYMESIVIVPMNIVARKCR
jgi:hypothetical protein